MSFKKRVISFYKRLLWCWHQQSCPCHHVDWDSCPCIHKIEGMYVDDVRFTIKGGGEGAR